MQRKSSLFIVKIYIYQASEKNVGIFSKIQILKICFTFGLNMKNLYCKALLNSIKILDFTKVTFMVVMVFSSYMPLNYKNIKDE